MKWKMKAIPISTNSLYKSNPSDYPCCWRVRPECCRLYPLLHPPRTPDPTQDRCRGAEVPGIDPWCSAWFRNHCWWRTEHSGASMWEDAQSLLRSHELRTSACQPGSLIREKKRDVSRWEKMFFFRQPDSYIYSLYHWNTELDHI